MIQKFFLTISSTWIYVILYYINFFLNSRYENWADQIKPNLLKIIILLIITLISAIVPYCISRHKPNDILVSAKLIELQDNSFVPSYLGYFFISINAQNFETMISFYFIIFIFMYFAGVEYFNPLFLIFGYHIYKVETDNGVQCVLILKSREVIRSSDSLHNLRLYRINNLTYIGSENFDSNVNTGR